MEKRIVKKLFVFYRLLCIRRDFDKVESPGPRTARTLSRRRTSPLLRCSAARMDGSKSNRRDFVQAVSRRFDFVIHPQSGEAVSSAGTPPGLCPGDSTLIHPSAKRSSGPPGLCPGGGLHPGGEVLRLDKVLAVRCPGIRLCRSGWVSWRTNLSLKFLQIFEK
jgi:hypothetical protein